MAYRSYLCRYFGRSIALVANETCGIDRWNVSHDTSQSFIGEIDNFPHFTKDKISYSGHRLFQQFFQLNYSFRIR